MLDLLTGERSGHLLQSALTGQPDGKVPGFRHQVARVLSRPGAGAAVSYQVWYHGPAGEVADQLVATSAPVAAAVQVVVDDQPISIWRHPADPDLPGLAIACEADQLAQLIANQPQAIEMRVYRPLRRAVIGFSTEAETGRQHWFAKVIRTGKLAGVEARHRLFEAAGIGPSIGPIHPDGVLITARAPGQPLADLLSAAQHGQLATPPDALDVLDALDRLPAALLDLPAHPSWTERTDFHARMATELLPDRASEISRLARRISALAAHFPAGEVVPTHGDCYEANLFWDDIHPTFIDLDTAGPGHRVDDLACVLAHLAVLPQLSPAHYPRGHEVVDQWHDVFARRVHPGALAVRVAGVLLSLVCGSDRETALHRLDLVRSWLGRAEEG